MIKRIKIDLAKVFMKLKENFEIVIDPSYPVIQYIFYYSSIVHVIVHF